MFQPKKGRCKEILQISYWQVKGIRTTDIYKCNLRHNKYAGNNNGKRTLNDNII